MARTTTSPEWRPTRIRSSRPCVRRTLLRIRAHGRLHRQRGVAGTQRVVFVGNGGAKERHNAIAEHLIDRALEAVDRVHHHVDGRIEELLGGFGIKATDEFGGVLEIGKEHRDLLALAFQRATGGEDLLRQIGRGVGEGGLSRDLHGSRGGGGTGASIARPDQAAPRIVADLGMGIEEFLCEIVQGVVIQLKLSLEGPIGHAAPLAQQGDHLIHDRDKVHPVSSLPGARLPYACSAPS